MHGLCLTRNVCKLSDAVVKNFSGSEANERILSGLIAYRSLLIQVFSDEKLVKYQDALNAVSLLFKAVDTGETQSLDKACVLVNKNSLKQVYKKNIQGALDYLENHHFNCVFYKDGEPVKQFKESTDFELYYEASSDLFVALRNLIQHARAANREDNYATGGALLYKADYDAIYGLTSLKATDIYILRGDIVRTLGDSCTVWGHIAKGLTRKLRLVPSCSYSLAGCPQWTIHFYRGGKSLCHFDITAESLYIGMAIPYARIKRVLAEMETYVQPVQEYIRQNFHCYGCKGCGNGIAEEYEGIEFCKKNAWSRYIQYKIQTPEEADTVYRIIETCLGED
jgi:hypothetical protein